MQHNNQNELFYFLKIIYLSNQSTYQEKISKIMKASQLVKLIILLIPTITFVDTNLISRITPFSFITSILILILLYFFHTSDTTWKNIKQFAKWSLSSWLLCLFISQLDHIIVHIYKIYCGQQLMIFVKMLLIMINFDVNWQEVTVKEQKIKGYDPIQSLEGLQ